MRTESFLMAATAKGPSETEDTAQQGLSVQDKLPSQPVTLKEHSAYTKATGCCLQAAAYVHGKQQQAV